MVKPGEKVRLIEEVHDLLEERPWPRRRLVLEQFGFKLLEREGDWNDPEGDYEYVLRILQHGPEDRLRELAAFLRGEDAQPTHAATDSPWGELPVRAFLSHVHEERYLVGEVKKLLAEYFGIDAFVAHDDIDVSKRWRDVIKAGLSSCDLFVSFLHERYHPSQWCDQEVGWALGRDLPIIVIRPEGVPRGHDGFLEEHQELVLTKEGRSSWHIARTIFLTALNDPGTRDAGIKSLVEAFVSSHSFDTTRFFWSHIEKVATFEPAQLRRMEFAVETNPQVYDANTGGVLIPDLVKALVARFEPPAPPDPWSDEPPF